MLFSCGRVEVMIRWRPVVSLANLVKSRLPYSACQRNLKQQPKWQCDYLNIIFLMPFAASRIKHSKHLCDIPIAMPWPFRALHHTERNLGCPTFLYHRSVSEHRLVNFFSSFLFFFLLPNFVGICVLHKTIVFLTLSSLKVELTNYRRSFMIHTHLI